MKNLGFKGKTTIVTGASSGIGKATAIKLATEGANVVLAARNQQRLHKFATELTEQGAICTAIPTDITQPDQIDDLINATVATYDGIDVLVNAAGIIANGSIESTSIDEWDNMMNINVRSLFLLTQKAVPYLIPSKGNIVNVSSVTGTRPFPNVLAYCVSKAAVDQFTRCTALELAPKGVRVNAVNPGVTVTELHRRGGMDEAAYQQFLEHSKTTHPLGRAGTAEEVADLIVFLASPHAEWITGVTYSIDGGRAQTCLR
ncbi:glucose 1-dehydrogenase [candidate division KSB1 bacterium]|nr:glucose 1-dehydrogenase [candidate division KSB1 bacterium]